jgi:AcrR family transcriptional regulator
MNALLRWPKADIMATLERVPRATQMSRTRRRLVDVALRLFSEQGYDATATEQIAAEAGVSPRTFFRYFPTKESVVFFGEYDFIRSFGHVLAAQPNEISDLAAVREALIILAPGIERFRTRVAQYHRAVESSTALLGQRQAHAAEHTRDIAQAIAARRGLEQPDAGCTLLAAVTHVVLSQAIDQWVAGDWPSTTRALATGFDLLANEMHGDLSRDGDPRPDREAQAAAHQPG